MGGYKMYGQVSLEDACEEFLKLIIFDRIKYPLLVTSTRKELVEDVIPKLLERANHIELFPQYRVGHGDLLFQNGVRLFLFDSFDPDRIRGFNGDLGWLHNEQGWSHRQDMRDMVMFALRIGEWPTIMTSKAIDKT